VNEERIRILSTSDVLLDGRVGRGSTRAAAICHPHPRFGGSMENGVVLATRDALAGLGLTTLRFDLRGVGASTGSWDDGRGEADDVAAAAAWLWSNGAAEVHLVAYSFGAAMAARALGAGLDATSVALVSPPVDFMDLGDDCLPPVPTLVVAGDHDTYASPASVDAWLARQPAVAGRLTRVTLPGVDHFYQPGEPALARALAAFLAAPEPADVP
jgi:hypothetical protein